MKKEERRKQILQYFEEFAAENRYAPTVRNIQDRFGIKSTATVFEDLNALVSEGLISKVGNRFVPNYTESYLRAIRAHTK